MKAFVPSLLGAAALTAAAHAGGSHPLPVAYVADSGNDVVWRMHDRDFDGDYDDAGETAVFYDGTLAPLALSVPSAVALLPDGTLLVADAGTDLVLALRDDDHDGEAHSAGEHRVFFDGTAGNPSGIEMSSVGDLFLAPDGTLWVTTSNAGAGGMDAVFWLRDVNMDGDANDAGESGLYYQLFTSAVGDSLPTGVVLGPDGALYYAENGSTGVVTKGLWRLEDTDLSGSIDQPGEATLYFQPAPQSATPFFWDVTVANDGSFLMPDSGNELIWKARDVDTSGSIDVGTEDVLWWQVSSSTNWQLCVGLDDSVYVAESQTPERVLRLRDADTSGTIDQPSESSEPYSAAVSASVVGNLRALCIDPVAGFASAFCDASDGALGACPCSNPGAPHTGCDTPIPAGQGGGTTGGIHLTLVDLTTSPARATLSGGGFPSASSPAAIVLRSPSLDAGSPVVFGDGVRCVSAVGLVRLAATTASNGTSTHAFNHGAGAGTFHYQLWFRNTPSTYCDPFAAFGLSNGQSIAWP